MGWVKYLLFPYDNRIDMHAFEVNSLQYTKNYDYKFLVEENKRLTGELGQIRDDNKKLTQQINDMAAKLRDASF